MKSKKNIAISLLSVSPQRATGSFIYIKNLLGNLFVSDDDNNYFLILNKDGYEYFKDKFSGYPNVKFQVLRISRDVFSSPLRAILKLIARAKKDDHAKEEILKKEIQYFVEKNKIDIVFYPFGVIYPAGLKNVKTVTTIFDIQHEYLSSNFPEKYLKRRKRDSIYAIRNSDRIIAISQFTKLSLMEKYGVDPDKVSVIYLAPQEQVVNHCSQLGLPDNFVFYPAAMWPHKNHKILIEAMSLLRLKFPDIHLIFTGPVKNKKLKEELVSLAVSCGLKDRTNFMGFVLDENMSLIYKKAKVLVFPSSFEGFGIPLVEAFSYGVPVIAADNTSISEIVGTAGILVETGNVQALAGAIEEVLSDDNFRQDLIKRGHERARDFSWAETARKTLDVFNCL